VPKIKYFIQQSWLLIVSSFCFGLLIAASNAALSPQIERNLANKLNQLTIVLLPAAKQFVPLDADIEVQIASGKKEKVKIYKALSDTEQCVGWSFKAVGEGFSGKLELVVAVDKDFEKIAGFDVLVSSESAGIGDQIKLSYFRSQFAGAPVDELTLVKTGNPTKIDSEIVAITGASVSSEAVVNILNSFLSSIKKQMKEKGLLGDGAK
jgi:electron transport complex protein RnfG